jgi:hypothetical protein
LFDPYEVLGIPPTATSAEIRRAYRREAMRWHPDKNVAPGAHERFLRVQRAFEILGKGRRRRTYDTFREPAAPPPARRSRADFFRMHRARGGPPHEVRGEGDRQYVLRPDYRQFTWMGLRFRNTERAHGTIAFVLAAPVVAVLLWGAWPLLVYRPRYVPWAILVFGLPPYLTALALVVATARWRTVRYPWNRRLDLEPEQEVTLVASGGSGIALYRDAEALGPADVVAILKPGVLATVVDVGWHPDPDREVYRVRTAGGSEGWVKRSNLEARAPSGS